MTAGTTVQAKAEVRELTLAELPELVPLARLFYEEGKLPGTLCPEIWIGNLRQMVSAGMAGIFGVRRGGELVGTIGGIVYPEPLGGELQAMEMFWFVRPEARGAGLALLPAFEEWARGRGARRIVMIHLANLNPERLRRLYERRGYREIETHYMKELD